MTEGQAEITARSAFGEITGRFGYAVVSAGSGEDALAAARLIAGGLYLSGAQVFMTCEPVPVASLPFYSPCPEETVAVATGSFGSRKHLVILPEGAELSSAKERGIPDAEGYKRGVESGKIVLAQSFGYGKYVRAFSERFLPDSGGDFAGRKSGGCLFFKEGEFGGLFVRAAKKTALYSPMNGRAFRSLPHILTLAGFGDVRAAEKEAYPSRCARIGVDTDEGLLRAAGSIAAECGEDVLFVSDPSGRKLLIGVKEKGKVGILGDEEIKERLGALLKTEKALGGVSFECRNGLYLKASGLRVPDAAAAAIYAVMACV